jgi:electron transport complex protein RnfB
MDITSIIVSGSALGAMGLMFGAALAFASQKFEVEVDPTATAIREVLPGANCGGCGFPGCDQFAAAVVAGNAPVNGCPVGGKDCASSIAEIMGVTPDLSARKVAHVICKGDSDLCQTKFKYDGIQDCKAAMLVGSDKNCDFGCMGYGTCEKVCPFDAISINEKGLAIVNQDKCTACGLCISACPKKVIALVPFGQEVIVNCNNKERGAHVKKNCGVSCIACGICEKSCEYDAIHVKELLAVIDYSKCVSCMVCTEKCPTKAISGDLSKKTV